MRSINPRELVAWMTERSTDWVLIGGLMAASFDVDYDHPWRPTEDIDSLFDIRHAQRAHRIQGDPKDGRCLRPVGGCRAPKDGEQPDGCERQRRVLVEDPLRSVGAKEQTGRTYRQ